MGFPQSRMMGRKAGNDRWFRQVRTTQKRRLWDVEYGRSARAPDRLPNAWDDRTRHVDGFWKRHRLAQFRPKSIGHEPFGRARPSKKEQFGPIGRDPGA